MPNLRYFLLHLLLVVALAPAYGQTIDSTEVVEDRPAIRQERPKDSRISEADWLAIRALEDTMGLLSYTVLHDSLPDNRFLACRALIPRLVQALKYPYAFDYPFERLQYLSIQYPPDRSFRIFTWQLFVNKEEYRYYGAIQRNTADLQLYPLVDRSFELEDETLEQQALQADQWYGYVVYDLQQFEGAMGRQYLIFGADSYGAYHRRKIVDVVSFQPNGQPLFGAPVFVEKDEESGQLVGRKSRLVQHYSAASYVSTRYESSPPTIVLENLIPVAGIYGEGPTNVPDGSYLAYRLAKDGKWYLIPKLFTHTYPENEYPREAQPAKTGKRDIFGRRVNR